MGSVCFILLFVVSLVEVITGYYLMLYTIFDRKKMNRCLKCYNKVVTEVANKI